LHHGVDVLDIEEDAGAGAAELARRLRGRLRERVGEHHDRVADLDLGMPDLPVRSLHPHALLRSERGLVELDRLGRILEHEVRHDGVVPLWNRLRHTSPLFSWLSAAILRELRRERRLHYGRACEISSTSWPAFLSFTSWTTS